MALPALPRLADRLTVVSVKSKTGLPDATVAVPRIQLGLYKMSGREARESVREALTVGYRGFDCAQMYYNEREAGLAIKNFLAGPQNTQGLRREDIFYTSKLAENETSYDAVKRSIAQSVEACGLGYIDLFLLHSPYGGKKARLASWKALEDAVLEGKVRAAGVSNYGVAHVSSLPILGVFLFLSFPFLFP
jgi:diketogulonate reductase-like aldo/keto reductase